MKKHIEAEFNLCDHLNPGCGYQLKITNAYNGETLLRTGNDPATGEPLLTAADCVKVIETFIPPVPLKPLSEITVGELDPHARVRAPGDYVGTYTIFADGVEFRICGQRDHRAYSIWQTREWLRDAGYEI